jgi:O-antigen/teichoic acid export membrane protein
MSRSRQVLINALAQWGMTALSSLLGLLIVPYLINRLGQDGYGLVVVILAIPAFCALADLGISGALTRQLSAALAQEEGAGYNHYASTGVAMNLLIGAACAGAIVTFAVPMARLFSVPATLFDEGVALLRTFGAAYVFLTFLMLAPKSILASHNRFDLACLIDAVRRLLQSVGLFGVLSFTSLGLLGWALVCVGADLLATVFLWRAARRICDGVRIRPSEVRAKSLRELVGLGSRLAALQISDQLSTNANPFVLSACLGPAAVALYRPPAQVMSAVSMIVFTLAGQLHPLATQAHVQREKADLAMILFRGTKYTMLTASVTCGIAISLAEPICRIWLMQALGVQYATCAAVLTILAITTLAGGAQWPVLLGMNRTGFAAYGRLALAVLNICASWLLVRYTQLGVLGVVLPTMVIELAWRPVLIRYVCRAVGVNVTDYLRQSYLAPLLVGGVVAGAGLLLENVAHPVGLWTLICAAAGLGLLGATLIWVFAFNSTERAGMECAARSIRLRRCKGGV